MRDLSVIVPGRNEEFFAQTVCNVLENIEADTEIIAICDGYIPSPPIVEHNRVTIIYKQEPIGQRAATNLGASVSQAKYIMKLDAHCAVSKGFDAALIEDCQPDWTMVPMMYNLHAFDWKCKSCDARSYQGSPLNLCEKCGAVGEDNFEKVIVWQPKKRTRTLSWRFDDTLHFQYWHEHKKRPECQGDLIETMSFIGACMFLERERFWELGGMDENHGSWGQFGTEWACKSWLSGGKLITTKKAWFGHMFRTGNFTRNGESSFPYPLSQQDIDKARKYSRSFWEQNKWEKAIYPLEWLVDKFAPVPGWGPNE